MIEHLQINDVVPCVHYDSDGVQAAFTFPFALFKAADLDVWIDKGRVTSGFTVSGIGITAGGAVLFAVPPAAGCRVTLRRRMALERISDFQTDGIIRAKTLNDELDYQVAAVQQVADDVSRCVQRPFTSASTADLSLPDPAKGRCLKWNAAGDGLENSQDDPDELRRELGQAVTLVEADTAMVVAARQAVEATGTAVAAAAAVASAAAAAAAAAASSVGNPLSRDSNLADLADAGAARANLGLGAAASLSVEEVRRIPQLSMNAHYTLNLADAGRHLLHPAGDAAARVFTIPANAAVAFPIGTAVTFVNQNGAGALSIAIAADTLRLAGSGSTGTRTVAANGLATALKIAATEWIISGTGVS